ncbi:MAG: hypothetical protein Q9225_002323 [Loekoesia sp. 1 TL-2023]
MLGYGNLLWFSLHNRPQETASTFILAAYFDKVGIIEKMLSNPIFLGKISHLEALLHISCTSYFNTISLILDDFERTLGPTQAPVGSLAILAGSFVSGNIDIAEATISRLRRLDSYYYPLIKDGIFKAAIISGQHHGVATKLDTETLELVNSVRRDILGEDQHYYWTVFTIASATGSKAIMEMVISLGLIDHEPKQLELALIIASLMGHTDIIAMILRQQPQLPVGDAFVVSLSHATSHFDEQHESTLRLLLDALDPVNPLSTPYMKNIYPLVLVSQSGHLPSLQNLLERGAQVGVTDDWGRTALHYAAENGHSDVVLELLSKMTPEEVRLNDNEGLDAETLATGAGERAVSVVLRNHLELTGS